MNDPKYIVVDFTEMKIFSGGCKHRDEAEKYGTNNVTSAGFIKILVNISEAKVIVECYGESDSLGVKSNPVMDNLIAKIMLGLTNKDIKL